MVHCERCGSNMLEAEDNGDDEIEVFCMRCGNHIGTFVRMGD